MQIKGVDNLTNLGVDIGFGAATFGACLLTFGACLLFTGGILAVPGWHGVSIGLMISGGAIFISGVTGGFTMLIRAKCLRDKENRTLKKASQLFRDSISDL